MAAALAGGASEETVKLAGAVSAGISANLLGIPLDRARIVIAHDTALAHGFFAHMRESTLSLSSAYAGGVARFGMKGTATYLNLQIPTELREERPFAASFACGLVFSPVLNLFRMLQLAKISGERYPAAAVRLFGTAAGLRSYALNTAIFAPGEGLRMMLCFGMKDFLVPYVRQGPLSRPCENNQQVAVRAAYLASVVTPAVSLVETSAAFVTETATAVQAQLDAAHGHGKHGSAARAEAFSAVMRPQYLLRCWSSLMLKNLAANFATFVFMFASDEYITMQRAKAKRAGLLRRRSSLEQLLLPLCEHEHDEKGGGR